MDRRKSQTLPRQALQQADRQADIQARRDSQTVSITCFHSPSRLSFLLSLAAFALVPFVIWLIFLTLLFYVAAGGSSGGSGAAVAVVVVAGADVPAGAHPATLLFRSRIRRRSDKETQASIREGDNCDIFICIE